MATRLETQRRREELRRYLRDLSLRGNLAEETIIPPVRELAASHSLSVPVALQIVKELVEEGVLRTVPSVGTFAARPYASQPDLYLLVCESPQPMPPLRTGFEDRITQLGGCSLCLSMETALAYLESGSHPDIAGVFIQRRATRPSPWKIDGVATVEFGLPESGATDSDHVFFDNLDGAAQATRHLLQLGHRRIAFLGLHGKETPPESFIWSALREDGWEATMRAAGYNTRGLSFLPVTTSESARPAQIDTSRQISREFLTGRDITAVVAANSFAARGLFETLLESGVPEADWPAVVTFDDNPVLEGFPATALRLPWEEIGRVGADLLWQRRQGQISGEAQLRLVPMRLNSRLSCRPDWARKLGLSTRDIAAMPLMPLPEPGEPIAINSGGGF